MGKLTYILLGYMFAAATQAGPVNLTITDDVYLENGVGKNDAYLMVETEASRTRISYLKVDLSTLPATVTNAVLRLTTTSASNESGGNGTVNLYEGSDTIWTEDSLSTANAPGEGTLLASTNGTYSPNQEVVFDLTSFLASTSKTTLSLVMKMESGGNDIWFGSTEGTGSPVLVINGDGSGGEVADRPTFDISKDLLLAQFDCKPDADDIHAQAALGSMLAHSDLDGVNYYAVAGAVGTQSGTFIHSEELFEMAFGAENTDWTDANGDWPGSVTRIKNKVRAVLDAGGKVWVQEAGQSNMTADWIAALISDGVAEAVIKENVIVVQHSDWNENMTAPADLTYVKDKANYVAIDDGNADPGDYSSRAYRGPETPNYTSTTMSFLIDAKSDSNTNAHTKALWTEADRIVDEIGFNASYSVIPGGGVDFSDCCENWWIFNIGSDADSVRKFWDRYVTKEEDVVVTPGTTVYQEANGLVVMDVESAPIVWGWEEETAIAGYLGTSYYTATADSFNTPGNGLLEYTFQVTNAGDYQFQWRSRITEGDSYTDYNDNFVRLVDANGNPVVPIENDLVPTGSEQWYKVYMNTENAWVWHAKNHDNNPKAIAWNLEADKTYTVQVSYRSKGHGIDRLLLWNRTGFGYSFGDLTGAANNTAALDALPLSAEIPAEPIRFNALTDFDISSVAAGDVPYYKDTARNALAIDAAEGTYRDRFARAILTETVSAGTYDVTITAMRELDGECTYQLYVDGALIGSRVNSTTTEDYALQDHTFSNVTISADAEIIVKSNSTSNEEIPENGGWAYARGRWTSLSFAPAGADHTDDAQVININFSKWSTPGVNTVFGADQGPATYSGTSWNNLVGSGTKSNLIDSMGYTTTVGVDVAFNGTWNITYDGHPGFTVLNEYIHSSGVSPFTFSGLNDGKSYDITFIGHGNNETDTTKFTIGGTSKIIAPVDVMATSWAEGENFVIFSGLTVDSNGEITGTYEVDSGAYACIAGIQIVPAAGPTGPPVMASSGIGEGRMTVSAGNLDAAKSYELKSAMKLDNPIVWTTLYTTTGVSSADWILYLTETSQFFQVQVKK